MNQFVWNRLRMPAPRTMTGSLPLPPRIGANACKAPPRRDAQVGWSMLIGVITDSLVRLGSAAVEFLQPPAGHQTVQEGAEAAAGRASTSRPRRTALLGVLSPQEVGDLPHDPTRDLHLQGFTAFSLGINSSVREYAELNMPLEPLQILVKHVVPSVGRFGTEAVGPAAGTAKGHRALAIADVLDDRLSDLSAVYRHRRQFFHLLLAFLHAPQPLVFRASLGPSVRLTETACQIDNATDDWMLETVEALPIGRQSLQPEDDKLAQGLRDRRQRLGRGEGGMPSCSLLRVIGGRIPPHHVRAGVTQEVLHVQFAGILFDRPGGESVAEAMSVDFGDASVAATTPEDLLQAVGPEGYTL